MPYAIKCLRESGSVFEIIQNPAAPPIPGFDQTFDLIYAFSVFSHLSEKYSVAWINYLLSLLKPGGHFIFTTRGERFIADLASIKAQSDDYLDSLTQANQGSYLSVLKRTFPDPEIIRQRLQAGEFQFYSVGHNELPDECTGETLIPRRFLETHYDPYFVSLDEDADAQQAIVVMKKAALGQ
jgi:SAM-dependent methyltransferase